MAMAIILIMVITNQISKYIGGDNLRKITGTPNR